MTAATATTGEPRPSQSGIPSSSAAAGCGKMSGPVLFSAKLSASFATFTVRAQQHEECGDISPHGDDGINTTDSVSSSADSHNVDLVIRTADGLSSTDAAAIWDEVEQCRLAGICVDVDVIEPYETCVCKPGCDYRIVHVRDVNGVVAALSLARQMEEASVSSACRLDGVESEKNGGTTEKEPTQQQKPRQSQSDQLILCREITAAESIAPPSPKPVQPGNNKSAVRRSRPQGGYNSSRSSKFVIWLVETFGREYLWASSSSSTSGSGSSAVLDVAGGGGSGGVTFELSLRRNMRSIIIDPRPSKLTNKQRRTLKFRKDGREKLQQPGLGVSHLATFMMDRYRYREAEQVLSLFDDDFSRTVEGDELLRSCAVVVGMHPDQATDAIVELAVRYGKPFAICPCCVFPTLNRHRKLDGGGEVRTYEDLCEYLRTYTVPGGGKVREVVLDFEGRNRVFYWFPLLGCHRTEYDVHIFKSDASMENADEPD